MVEKVVIEKMVGELMVVAVGRRYGLSSLCMVIVVAWRLFIVMAGLGCAWSLLWRGGWSSLWLVFVVHGHCCGVVVGRRYGWSSLCMVMLWPGGWSSLWLVGHCCGVAVGHCYGWSWLCMVIVVVRRLVIVMAGLRCAWSLL